MSSFSPDSGQNPIEVRRATYFLTSFVPLLILVTAGMAVLYRTDVRAKKMVVEANQ
jgi:hypothetical protein